MQREKEKEERQWRGVTEPGSFSSAPVRFHFLLLSLFLSFLFLLLQSFNWEDKE